MKISEKAQGLLIGAAAGSLVVMAINAITKPTSYLECVSYYARANQSEFMDRALDEECFHQFPPKAAGK